MKLQAVLLLTLAGGFAASTAVNIHLVLRLEKMADRSVGRFPDPPSAKTTELQPVISPEEFPALDALGLSSEQSERIRGCSMT